MKRILQFVAIALALAAAVQTVSSALNGTLIQNAYADEGPEPGGF